ncbi:putative secreted protein [Streptomyces davaonensis JCM 4913]|uniref:Putative secreted protein n=1 Tax=Streptomyces davaonensis (strain DSM 101723 / JCM 4913 / KCC S-0913 / 768) TaxID=1214101 RepID=K4R6H8_STRDJ|nr:hypothetical protein [Streptomyces davaonensis]CCK28695.1 putative secreted protein [Streptomyces davaonensis JCM 4913]
MRRARRRRRAAAVALAVAMPLLGGCGIQETDVIEAGGPASFQAFFNRDYDVLLFFRAPDGRLSPVVRTVGSVEATEPVPTERAVLALLDGPNDEDRAVDLSTALPEAGSTPTIEVDPSADGKVGTRLPLAVKGLSSTARRQLICTIAYSQDPGGQVVVELTGQDGATWSGTCGLGLKTSW